METTGLDPTWKKLMIKKIQSKKILSLFLVFFINTSPVKAELVWDFTNLPFNIGGMIESASSSASDAIRDISDEMRFVSGRVREAYTLIIKQKAIQTAINTYKNFLEAARIYQKTVHMISILEGNPGYTGLMRVAGDRDVRKLMGKDWSYMVDDIDAFESTFSGTDRRMRNAFSAYNRGHIPYNADLIYLHPRLRDEKKIYEKDLAKNKAVYVTAHAAISRAEEKVFKLEKMETAADATDNPKERDSLRNQFLIDIYQESTETNKTLSTILLQQNEQIKKDMNRRATDKLMANKAMQGWQNDNN